MHNPANRAIYKTPMTFHKCGPVILLCWLVETIECQLRVLIGGNRSMTTLRADWLKLFVNSGWWNCSKSAQCADWWKLFNVNSGCWLVETVQCQPRVLIGGNCSMSTQGTDWWKPFNVIPGCWLVETIQCLLRMLIGQTCSMSTLLHLKQGHLTSAEKTWKRIM